MKKLNVLITGASKPMMLCPIIVSASIRYVTALTMGSSPPISLYLVVSPVS